MFSEIVTKKLWTKFIGPQYVIMMLFVTHLIKKCNLLQFVYCNWPYFEISNILIDS